MLILQCRRWRILAEQFLFWRAWRRSTNQLRWSFERRDRVWRSNCSDSFLLSANVRAGRLVRYPKLRRKRWEAVIKSFRSDLITWFRNAIRDGVVASSVATARRERTPSDEEKPDDEVRNAILFRALFHATWQTRWGSYGVPSRAEIAAEKEQRTLGDSQKKKKLRNYKGLTNDVQNIEQTK